MSENTFLRVLLMVLAIGTMMLGLTENSYAKVIPNAYIVQVADSADINDVRGRLAKFTGGKIGHTYRHAIRGFSIHVPPGIAKSQMFARYGVIAVEPELEVELCSQTIPTSVDRIDIDLYNVAKIDGIDERVDVDIAIIDTGIDTDHPDLNVVGGRRFLPGSPTDYDDDNGHGSEVAGVLAALDNGIGVVGAAPGARLWALKCFDQNRAGTGDILAAIDWVVANASTIEILNMSWSGIHQAPLHRTAIQSCVNAGVVCFAAAGNSNIDVYGVDGIFNTGDEVWPAYFPEVAAISAMADSDGLPGGVGGYTGITGYVYADDSFAYFSNYSNSVVGSNPVDSPGKAIDLMMPAVDIYSTFMNGGYSYDSGTSLASPLAAGLAALYIAENGRATNAAGVYAIRQALIDSGAMQSNSRGLIFQNDPDSYDENIGYYTPGDLNKDGIVSLEDFAIFASAWLTGDGDVQYCPVCDIGIPADYSIGPLDLKVFVDNWLVGF